MKLFESIVIEFLKNSFRDDAWLRNHKVMTKQTQLEIQQSGLSKNHKSKGDLILEESGCGSNSGVFGHIRPDFLIISIVL